MRHLRKFDKEIEFNLTKDDLEDIFQDYEDHVRNYKLKFEKLSSRISISVSHDKVQIGDGVDGFVEDFKIRKSLISGLGRLEKLIQKPDFFTYNSKGFSVTFQLEKSNPKDVISFKKIFNDVYSNETSMMSGEEICIIYFDKNRYSVESICDLIVYSDRNEIKIKTHGSYITDYDIVTIYNALDTDFDVNNRVDIDGLRDDFSQLKLKNGNLINAWENPIYLNYNGNHLVTEVEMSDDMSKTEIYKSDKAFRKFWDSISEDFDGSLILISSK